MTERDLMCLSPEQAISEVVAQATSMLHVIAATPPDRDLFSRFGFRIELGDFVITARQPGPRREYAAHPPGVEFWNAQGIPEPMMMGPEGRWIENPEYRAAGVDMATGPDRTVQYFHQRETGPIRFETGPAVLQELVHVGPPPEPPARPDLSAGYFSKV